MDPTRRPVLTGGCQCGAVRYALYAEPTDPHVCHCRMCQKAFGSFFAPLTGVQVDQFAFTRGEPGVFRSSSVVERGFCRACGTPLFFRNTESTRISVSIGSLDDPARVPPAHQYGIEAKMPWFDRLHLLPGTTTEDDTPPELAPKLASRQHPDHDTDRWPPETSA